MASPYVDTRGVATQFLQWSRNHIYSILSRKELLILLPEIWVRSLGTFLEKVLDTQDRPTLMLASHHCVLRLKLIKNIFNTCILTHAHTSIRLSIQHGIIHPKTHTYLPLNKKEPNPCIYKPQLVKSYHTSKTRQQHNHGNKVSWQSRILYKVYNWDIKRTFK